MCEFLSFKIEPTEEGLKVVFEHSLESHSEIPGSGYEAEWTQDDNGESLEIRVDPFTPDAKADELKAWVLKNWRTRTKLIMHALETLDWTDQSLQLVGVGGLKRLPKKFKQIGGSLTLENCEDLEELPKGLSVGQNLYLNGCIKLQSLPDGLSVKHTVGLSYCTGLTSLPDWEAVERSLLLVGCTGLTSLPNGLKRVMGSLDLQDCTNITELPEGLTFVGDYLDVSGTGITKLPDGLKADRIYHDSKLSAEEIDAHTFTIAGEYEEALAKALAA